jgi:hypothetical protein
MGMQDCHFLFFPSVVCVAVCPFPLADMMQEERQSLIYEMREDVEFSFFLC